MKDQKYPKLMSLSHQTPPSAFTTLLTWKSGMYTICSVTLAILLPSSRKGSFFMSNSGLPSLPLSAIPISIIIVSWAILSNCKLFRMKMTPFLRNKNGASHSSMTTRMTGTIGLMKVHRKKVHHHKFTFQYSPCLLPAQRNMQLGSPCRDIWGGGRAWVHQHSETVRGQEDGSCQIPQHWRQFPGYSRTAQPHLRRPQNADKFHQASHLLILSTF